MAALGNFQRRANQTRHGDRYNDLPKLVEAHVQTFLANAVTIRVCNKAQTTWAGGRFLPFAAVLLGPDDHVWCGAWGTTDHCNKGRMTCLDRPLY